MECLCNSLAAWRAIKELDLVPMDADVRTSELGLKFLEVKVDIKENRANVVNGNIFVKQAELSTVTLKRAVKIVKYIKKKLDKIIQSNTLTSQESQFHKIQILFRCTP